MNGYPIQKKECLYNKCVHCLCVRARDAHFSTFILVDGRDQLTDSGVQGEFMPARQEVAQ